MKVEGLGRPERFSILSLNLPLYYPGTGDVENPGDDKGDPTL